MAGKHSKEELARLFSSSKSNKVMREFRKGKLKSSSGATVRDLSQARAIAISEAAKGELFARKLKTSTTIDKTSVKIEKPAKLKNALPTGKRQISRQRKPRTKFV